MSNGLSEIARRKQELIAQCAQEREALAVFYRHYRPPIRLRGSLASIGNILKAHPLWVAGVSGLLISGRARTLTRVGLELAGLWRAVVPLWSWWLARQDRRHISNSNAQPGPQ